MVSRLIRAVLHVYYKDDFLKKQKMKDMEEMAKFPVETIRHSASHLMAAAILELYPDVKFDIGPSTEDGFYYDFDFGTVKLSVEDLEKIEAKMAEIAAKKIPFERFEVSREEAQKMLAEKKQNFKVERLADIPEGETISFYRCGDFVDLCRGPHVDNTGDIGAFKLTSIAGSYYRGKESNPMLTRISPRSKKPRNATIADSARTSISSASPKRSDPAWFCGIRAERSSATRWKPSGARNITKPATNCSTRRISGARICGRPAVTSVSTRKACIRRCRSTRSTTMPSR